MAQKLEALRVQRPCMGIWAHIDTNDAQRECSNEECVRKKRNYSPESKSPPREKAKSFIKLRNSFSTRIPVNKNLATLIISTKLF